MHITSENLWSQSSPCFFHFQRLFFTAQVYLFNKFLHWVKTLHAYVLLITRLQFISLRNIYTNEDCRCPHSCNYIFQCKCQIGSLHCSTLRWFRSNTSRVVTLGVVVVVVTVVDYFLWFYFHGKGILNVIHNHNHTLPHQPHHSVWLTTLTVVVQAHAAPLKRFKAKV